jgi:hypothetical protein
MLWWHRKQIHACCLLIDVKNLTRELHRYGFTRSVSKMGAAGEGTVLNFGILQHTTYLYCSVMGIHGLIL